MTNRNTAAADSSGMAAQKFDFRAGGDLVDIDLVENLAERVDQIADATGRADLRHAARLMRGDRDVGGRPRADDAAALDIVRHLLAEGRGRWSACVGVARKLSPDNAESVARRLLNKIPKKEVFSDARSDTAARDDE